MLTGPRPLSRRLPLPRGKGRQPKALFQPVDACLQVSDMLGDGLSLSNLSRRHWCNSLSGSRLSIRLQVCTRDPCLIGVRKCRLQLARMNGVNAILIEAHPHIK
ncbi:hypothetical protein ccbrp13_70960 [Ktedonobacteria bacterium brp13]|nr:hypothetical protein ccbrp13_70960 [Ktedonobacteria bacterium brp13]